MSISRFTSLLIFALLCTNGFSQPVVVQGTISSSLPVSVHNITVTIRYIDSSSTITDTVLTDSLGFYVDSVFATNINRIEVELEACTGSPNTIGKSVAVPGYAGRTQFNIDFTNYCFSADFTHWESNDTVQFFQNILGGVAPYSVLWDFGDTTTDTLNNPFKIYSAQGTYNVTLIVEDFNGDSALFTSSVQTQFLNVDFVHSQVAPLQIQFTDASTATLPSYSWSFGDGNFSNFQNPSHTYAAAGIYNVCLYVIDSALSAQGRTCDSVEASNFICQAAEQINTQGMVIELLDQSTTVPSNQFLTHTWLFGDGNTASNIDTLGHVYEQNGNYTVTHIISNNSIGCNDTSTQLVNISGLGPNQVVLSGTLNFRDGEIKLIESKNGSVSTLSTINTLQSHWAFPVNKNALYYVQGRLPITHHEYRWHFPTYYPSEVRFEEATGIYVSNHSVTENHIVLVGIQVIHGFASAQGYITYASTALGAPDVDVYAFDEQNEIVDKAITDANGNYALTQLPKGLVSVQPVIPGYQTIPTRLNVVIITEYFYNINFTIYDEQIIGLEETHERLEGEEIEIYPNPTSQHLYVNIPEDVEYQLFSMQGKALKSGIMNSVATNEIELIDVPVGTYVLKMFNDRNVWIKNVIKVGK